MNNYSIVSGWPGLHWITKSATNTLPITNHQYYCKINNNKIHNTHAIVRGLNWWNDLFNQLKNPIFKS